MPLIAKLHSNDQQNLYMLGKDQDMVLSTNDYGNLIRFCCIGSAVIWTAEYVFQPAGTLNSRQKMVSDITKDTLSRTLTHIRNLYKLKDSLTTCDNVTFANVAEALFVYPKNKHPIGIDTIFKKLKLEKAIADTLNDTELTELTTKSAELMTIVDIELNLRRVHLK